MAYDREHLKVDFLFKDISSDEIALTGFTVSEDSGWDGASVALGEIDLAGGAGATMTSAMEVLMDNAALNWANYSQLYGVKIAAISTSGAYLGDAKVYEMPTPVIGAAVGTLPQSTVVCSLRSGSSIGSANYGRMYLPHTRLTLGTSLSVGTIGNTGTVVAAFKTAYNAWIAVINTAVTDVVAPYIMSNQAPKPSKLVTQLKVGTVTDTQRRRRNRLPELYSSIAR